MTKATCLLIGLGQIGLGYDINLDRQKYTLSLANAISKNPCFDMIAAIDPSPIARQTFQAHYHKPAYPGIDSIPKSITKVDLIIIATPTKTHYSCIRKVLDRFNVEMLLCEKPFTSSYIQAKLITDLCADRSVKGFVNYSRRADPVTQKLKIQINNGLIKLPLQAVCIYSKGLLHSCSHFFDLFSYWLGKHTAISSVIRQENNSQGLDMHQVIVQYHESCVQFIPLSFHSYEHFSIDLYASNGRLRYDYGGQYSSWTPLADIDDVLCRELATKSIPFDNFQDNIQAYVLDEVHAAFLGSQTHLATFEEALNIHDLIAMINRTATDE